MIPGHTIVRSLSTALVALVLVAAAHALWRGDPAARSAAFALVTLGLPAALAALVAALVERRAPQAFSAAATVSLYGFAVWAMTLHSRWVIFAPRPRSLLALAGVLGLTALVTLALRWLFFRVATGLEQRTRRVAAALAGILAGALAAVGLVPAAGPPPLAAAPHRPLPNVLLVTIDTLRADHLSTYGYGVHGTPAFDRLATEGLRFDSAWSTAPWTLPSLASMMTGYQPSVHGFYKTEVGVTPGVATLAGILAAAGYDTHAVVSNVFATRKFGLHAGFRTYDQLRNVGIYDDLARHPLYHFLHKTQFKLLGETAERLTNRALDWLRDGRAPQRPFFLWLHYMDPHGPYGGRHVLDDLPCGGREAPRIGVHFDEHARIHHGGMELEPVERDHLVHLYDAEVRYLDRHFGRLLAELDREGLTQNTILVVTADHGEEFWDHGGFAHGHSLYPELLRVPLLVRWPDETPPGRVIEAPVSLLGLMPTLVDATGLPVPAVQGRPIPLDGSEPAPGAVFGENILYGAEQKSVRDERWTLIWEPATDRTERYDRRTDPHERSPLAPPAGETLSAHLEHQIAQNDETRATVSAAAPVALELSDLEREQLRALGYVD